MDKDWIFQDDNDRKHRAAFVTNWLNREHIHCASNAHLFSPNINPIDHLYHEK